MTTIVTDANFTDETATGVVLVDFYADWCGPCQMMMPAVEELSQEYAGKAKVVKINIDDNGETAQKFGVMSIPTFVILKDGEPVETIVGGVGKAKLAAALAKVVG